MLKRLSTLIAFHKPSPPELPEPPPKPELTFKALERRGLRVANSMLGVHLERTIAFEGPCRLNNMQMQLDTSFKFGAYSYMRGGVLKALRSVGRYTSIGPYSIIGEPEHPITWLSSSPAFYAPQHFAFSDKRPHDMFIKRTPDIDPSLSLELCEIGNDVWIGANCVIRRGVKIGDGAIIGAGSIVLRDVEPYSIVAGVPAKLIRFRYPDPSVIEAVRELKWWEFDASELKDVPVHNISGAIDAIGSAEARGEISRRKPRFKKVLLSNNGCRWPEPKSPPPLSAPLVHES